MRFRQAVLEYSNKYGVTRAAIRYKLNRQYIYRWRKRYDGTVRVTPKFCVKSNECRNGAKFICRRQRLDRLPPMFTT